MATRVDKYRKSLQKTEQILREGYISAAELAKRLKVSRQTAYSRIQALEKLLEVDRAYDRIGDSGPATTVFKIIAGKVPEGPR